VVEPQITNCNLAIINSILCGAAVNNANCTWVTAEVILVPPEAPTTKIASPSEFTTITGLIEERGIFPGTMKFSGEGGTPNAFVIFGAEKSSMISLRMIPVLMDLTLAPKLPKTNATVKELKLFHLK
jgi:hypothetical protein